MNGFFHNVLFAIHKFYNETNFAVSGTWVVGNDGLRFEISNIIEKPHTLVFFTKIKYVICRFLQFFVQIWLNIMASMIQIQIQILLLLRPLPLLRTIRFGNLKEIGLKSPTVPLL